MERFGQSVKIASLDEGIFIVARRRCQAAGCRLGRIEGGDSCRRLAYVDTVFRNNNDGVSWTLFDGWQVLDIGVGVRTMQESDEAKPRTTELRLSCWEEFEEKAATFDDPNRKLWDEVWFRGQADARWALETTLERRSKVTEVGEYLRLISSIKPAVETFTGLEFKMPDFGEVEKGCREYDRFQFFLFESMTYMAHLRHGGFPSPLLDWTKSPYVAAYFAFSKARNHDGEVAIYAYRERPNRFKIGSSDAPQILSCGPLFKTHNRHFRQQSRYTTCAQFINGKWYFSPHDAVYSVTSNRDQDLLWKMTIPASERRKVLRHFDKFNMNEFTLFASEEGLLEMLAMREIDMRE